MRVSSGPAWNARAAEGTSIDHMREQLLKLERPLNPLIESGDVQRSLVRAPTWGMNTPSGGVVIVSMAPWNEREISTAEAQGRMMGAWSQIPELRVFTFMRSGISRHGGGQPVQFVLGGTNYDELIEWRDIVLRRAMENPRLTRVDSDLKETQPQLQVRIDQDRAAALGISTQTIGETLQTMMSERVVTTYVVDGEEYDVVLNAKLDVSANLGGDRRQVDADARQVDVAFAAQQPAVEHPADQTRAIFLQNFEVDESIVYGNRITDLQHINQFAIVNVN